MKIQTKISLLIGMLLFSVSINQVCADEKETITKTLKFSDPSKAKELIVDNVWGSVRVEGEQRDDVSLVAHKTIEGKTTSAIERAKKEVKLEITQKNNEIDLYVDGPFRCSHRSKGVKFRKHRRYEVHYDFHLKVPLKIDLSISTVNEGDIYIENVSGLFDVDNVNGGVEMVEISGSGRAYTLNGNLTVTFKENPASACYFGSLNEDVDISFLKSFSADCLVKTFNGNIYSDFPVTYLPHQEITRERERGMYVYKSDGYMSIRVGEGGPEIEFDAFNGDIFIAQRGE